MKAFGLVSRTAVGALFALLFASAVDAAPIAYWTFDFTAADSVGPNSGTLNGGTAYNLANVAPGTGSLSSLELPGDVGSYFSIPTQSGSASGSYTVSLWANVRTSAGPHNFFSTRSPSDNSFDMKFQAGNRVHGDIGGYNPAGGLVWGNTAADAVMAYNVNQWYHLAYVVTPTQWRVYVDGVQKAQGGYTSTLTLHPVLFDASHLINIGRYNGGSEPTNGFIDEVSVFSYPLTASQVQSLSTGTSPLAIAAPDRHGALRYIPISSDATSQISTSKTYTHKLDFGTGALGAANVNGVQFLQAGTGNFPSGNGATNIPAAHAGNNAYNGLGAVGALYQDMVYNAAEGEITLTGLTPGQGYDTRLYLRNWTSPTAGARPVSLQFDVDNDGLPERVTRVNEDNAKYNAPGFTDVNQAYALSYTFVAQNSTMKIRANTLVGNATFHLYGLTNELTDRRPVDSLWSTGLDNDGSRLLGGRPDPHYSLVSAPTGSAALSTLNHPNWAPNDLSSSFIGVVEPGATNVPVGEYRYQTTFDLTGFDPYTTEVVMTLFVDNTLTDVRLNGVSTGITLSLPAGTPAADQTFNLGGGRTFTLSAGFQPGINTLEFVMTNDGTADNPGGLRVDLSGTALPVPEPSTWALLLIGAAIVGLRRRK